MKRMKWNDIGAYIHFIFSFMKIKDMDKMKVHSNA